MGELTVLLHRWVQNDDLDAFDQAVSLLLKDLKRVAHVCHRERPDPLFSTTELLNQAFVALIPAREKLEIHDRKHFLNLIAHTIKLFLGGELRRYHAKKRGENPVVIPFDEAGMAIHTRNMEREFAIIESLEKLRDQDPDLVEVVLCRYFIGMNIQETAAALQMSTATVSRKWSFAKPLLHKMLESTKKDEPSLPKEKSTNNPEQEDHSPEN